jgi:hypothetical protein
MCIRSPCDVLELRIHSPSNGLPSLLAHRVGVPLNALASYLLDARRSIGPKEQAEEPGHEIVEELAVARIRKIRAFGATRELVLDAARPHLAPSCLCVFMAAGAPAP